MLKEHFIASSRSAPLPPAANTAQLKDAGIFLHTFQPQPTLRSTLKKSQTQQNCLAFNRSHIFTAQNQKAVVHVYSRIKGSQEAIVPFPERIRSLTLVSNGSVLALGTEGGHISLWEIYTGRYFTTVASHLQAVTSLVADPTSNFLLSASPDSNVLVWSLLDLQAFASPSLSDHDVIKARHQLTGHSGPVTALTVGHGQSSANIALSASEDKSLIVWNYHEGSRLRTVILNDIPRCLTLDPADRAAFIGFDDGSVQLVDFLTPSPVQASIHDASMSSTPIQPPNSSRWTAATAETSQVDSQETLCVGLSYDGTTLLSGHGDGAINKWDIAGGRFAGTLALLNGAPITNLAFETPDGLRSTSRHEGVTVVKPRLHEPFSKLRSSDLTAAYGASLHLSKDSIRPHGRPEFEFVGVSGDDLSMGVAELLEWSKPSSRPKAGADGSVDTALSEDLIMLDDAASEGGAMQPLQERLALLEDANKTLSVEMVSLQRANAEFKRREKEHLAKQKVQYRTERRQVERDVRDQRSSMKRQRGSDGVTTMNTSKSLVNGDADVDGDAEMEDGDDNSLATSEAEQSDP